MKVSVRPTKLGTFTVLCACGKPKMICEKHRMEKNKDEKYILE